MIGSTLTDVNLPAAAAALAKIDPLMQKLFAAQGVPPLWRREPGFATLVHIILEQQVSLASGQAAFDRLFAAIPKMDPKSFLSLDDIQLKTIGFSRQKAAYCRGLAESILDNTIDLDKIALLADGDARNALMKIKGIGCWTADIYLLMSLCRTDIWPTGDLALVSATRRLIPMAEKLTSEELIKFAECWQPYRAVAARMLWQYYLGNPQLFKRIKV
jgi:DNA-3-methyladenine glycosylase II